jgi:hypothetical protein
MRLASSRQLDDRLRIDHGSASIARVSRNPGTMLLLELRRDEIFDQETERFLACVAEEALAAAFHSTILPDEASPTTTASRTWSKRCPEPQLSQLDRFGGRELFRHRLHYQS